MKLVKTKESTFKRIFRQELLTVSRISISFYQVIILSFALLLYVIVLHICYFSKYTKYKK